MLDTVFLAAQALAFVGWVPLFALPWLRRPQALRWARGTGAALCLLYVIFFLPNAGAIPTHAGYSLEGILLAFEVPPLRLAAWIHYLAFDLWVGAWEAEDAEARGLSHRVLLLCLFATMMIGPAGLLLYLAISRLKPRERSTQPKQ